MMNFQENGGGTGVKSGHVLMSMSSNCMRLDNGKSSLTVVQPKELYSSGDEVTPKARKSYTISKQRERWTEEEHKKFLEALKLYGRAWRRVEEHIGTKTAVQIRSHAQKFFSKVVRESGSNSSSMKSIEIPPPRPKRKPIHPYPRKLVHPSTKGMSVSEQPERSPSPIPMNDEQENRSPTSVLSAVGSDTTGSMISNTSNGCLSPVTSATGPNPVCFLLGEQENGSPWTTSSVEKERRSPSPVSVSDVSSQQDKPSMELQMGCKDHVCSKEASSVEPPPMSLKLFGRTVLVTDSHRPSSPIIGNIPLDEKSLPLIDTENQKEASEADVQNQSRTSPRNTMKRDLSGGSDWNQWACGVPPVYYCMQFKQEGLNSAEACTPIPWWGLLPFPPIHSHNVHSRHTPSDSCIQASGDKELSNKEGSRTVSITGSVSEVGLGDRNSDVVDSQNADNKVKEPVAVVCFNASENLAFSSRKTCASENKKEPMAVIPSKGSENSAFSIRPAGSRNCGKGFVPYKRCVAERDIQQPQIGGEEREGQRIRVCL